MTQKRIVLPSSIERFARSGMHQSTTQDYTVMQLMHFINHFEGDGPQDIQEAAQRIDKVCIDLYVRIAGARLLEAANHLTVHDKAAAIVAFEEAKSLLALAQQRAQGRWLLDVNPTDIKQAIAVIGYQVAEEETNK